jgi:hypothetical protein
MDKDTMEEHYSWLNDKYKKAKDFERKYRYGKNKKIREVGLKDLRQEIDELEYVAENNSNVSDLIIPKESSSLGKTIFWDEFLTPQYFTRDLETILLRIKNELERK